MTNDPEFLLTCTPTCCTVAGSWPIADCTEFCTSAAAMSRFVSSVNVQVIVEMPCELVELM